MAYKHKTLVFLALFIIGTIALSSIIYALPQGPQITYVSNSTAASNPESRNEDEKGTITVVTMDANQQNYRWKAYVGNVTGKLALDDATAYTIYDWTLGVVTGEVYVTRASSVTWTNVSCANDTSINMADASFDMSASQVDSINRTFNSQAHRNIVVATKNITNSTCRSTATYINDTVQVVDENAYFQEMLLKDDLNQNLIYATFIENNQIGYNNQTFDFQLLVAENESSTTPTTYYFYVELG